MKLTFWVSKHTAGCNHGSACQQDNSRASEAQHCRWRLPVWHAHQVCVWSCQQLSSTSNDSAAAESSNVAAKGSQNLAVKLSSGQAKVHFIYEPAIQPNCCFRKVLRDHGARPLPESAFQKQRFVAIVLLPRRLAASMTHVR